MFYLILSNLLIVSSLYLDYPLNVLLPRGAVSASEAVQELSGEAD